MRALKSSNSSVPATTIQNDRQQSAVKMAFRISVRLASSGCNWSAGICDMACISDDETYSGKKRPGISANSKAMPPVRPKLT